MNLLSVWFMVCGVLTMSQAAPINSTITGSKGGLCDYKRLHCIVLAGAFCPRCDADGNFLPQQCSGSTGYCWCVNVLTGEEIPNTKTPPGVRPVSCAQYIYCPYGWSSFGYRCFLFIDTPKTWTEAEFYCQFEGANLASVHSDEENHFIQSLTRGNTHSFPQTWIGGSDAIQLNLWMWSDGSKFHYENWFNDNHEKKDARCLKMNYYCKACHTHS
ncbi:PREDICTED: ladderlectin-like [Cyprinodon variegatus]|uniref:Ladderlectin-like n=1 Tax=Cyprinodon variegatus TaxID=28743 RepID=A0A3Q2DIU7_CYPVA|nr:PREDICTED: ladderlectin-like [Cyprinodon variegatus]